MCPKCGSPLTAGGNCPQMCGGAYTPPTAAEIAASRVLLLAAQVRS